MKKKFTANSPDDLVPIVRELIRLCKQTDSVLSPTLIFLSGRLGAGKTKFVQTFVLEAARSHGSRSQGCHSGSGASDNKIAEVASPTFALHQQYRLPGNELIHHFDLYRLESEDEAENVGFWDVLGSRHGIVFVEWPEKLPGFTSAGEFLTPGWLIVRVRFEVRESGAREIEIQAP